MSETDLLQLTVMIYEAATDPTLWPVFLKAYAEAMAADLTGLQVHYFTQHRSEALVFWGLSSPMKQSYNEYYSKLNVWREYGRSLYGEGRVLLSQEVYPYRLYKRTEFYNDYMRQVGGAHTTAAVISRDADQAMTLTALRSEAREPPDEPERNITKILLPHLQRARLIQQQLGMFEGAEAVMESSGMSVVFLTAGGSQIYASRLAEAIFRSDDGLSMRFGRLCAAHPATHAALEHAVRLAASPGRELDCPEAVLVERKSMRRSYQVVVAPLHRKLPQFLSASAPAVVVLIVDPEQERPTAAKLLQKLYGLTPKEAEVTDKLCEGKTVEHVADELEMQYETARTHLRRILSKTGASRQAELIILLAKLPRQTL